MAIRLFKIQVYFTMLLFVMLSCKKTFQPNVSNSESFIHVYLEEADQLCWDIQATNDNGFLLLGESGNFLKMVKTNEKGELIWQKKITTDSLNSPWIRRLNDGCRLISSTFGPGNLCKLDPLGNILFMTKFLANDSNLYVFGTPIESSEGNYLASYSDGYKNSGAGNNKIVHFDKQGKIQREIPITGASLGGHLAGLELINYIDSNQTYLFWGALFPNWNGSFRSDSRFVLAKQKFNGTSLIQSKKVIIDSNNYENVPANANVIFTKKKEIMFIFSTTDRNANVRLRFIKTDDDLNILVEKYIIIPECKNTFVFGISECPDGNYLLTGSYTLVGYASDQPIAIKIDPNCNILWYKTYKTKFSSYFSTGNQTSDGVYYFAGQTTGFGSLSTLNDFFMMKTDKFGNLK